MSGYHESGVSGGGPLAHSLKLALAVIFGGLVVFFVATRFGPRADAPAAPPQAAAETRGHPVKGVSELVLRAGANGHFTVNAMVNGTSISFLIDTGASSIYLTPADAARLGWTPSRLTFSERYESAAGEVAAAPVTLRSLRIGQLELYDLPASVGEQPATMSLLGMTFLKQFDSYQVRGDRLILTW